MNSTPKEKNFIADTLSTFLSKSIVPVVLYDEADLLWGRHPDNL